MTTIKILGPGCSNCKKAARLVEKVGQELGLELQLIKETDLSAILGYGAMSTPGVVIDEQLVHSGSVPSEAKVRAWLSALRVS